MQEGPCNQLKSMSVSESDDILSRVHVSDSGRRPGRQWAGSGQAAGRGEGCQWLVCGGSAAVRQRGRKEGQRQQSEGGTGARAGRTIVDVLEDAANHRQVTLVAELVPGLGWGEGMQDSGAEHTRGCTARALVRWARAWCWPSHVTRDPSPLSLA